MSDETTPAETKDIPHADEAPVADTQPAPAEPEPPSRQCALSGRSIDPDSKTGLHRDVEIMRVAYIGAAIASGRYGAGEAKQMIAHADAALRAALETPYEG